MTGFTADWLALREPADRRARSHELIESLCAWRRGLTTLSVVDLGAGTGALLRDLAPRLGGRQEWLLLDHDAALLGQARQILETWAEAKGWPVTRQSDQIEIRAEDGLDLTIRTRTADLNTAIEELDQAGVDLITASALLDLVSEPWLERLATLCQAHGAVFYAPLNYDGRMAPSPALPFDRDLRDLVNWHQKSDKGFGPALGPTCVEAAARHFGDRGFAVRQLPSDWRLTTADRPLVEALLSGWAEASAGLRGDLRGRIEAWLQQRRDLLEDPQAECLVGHQDLLALADPNQSLHP